MDDTGGAYLRSLQGRFREDFNAKLIGFGESGGDVGLQSRGASSE